MAIAVGQAAPDFSLKDQNQKDDKQQPGPPKTISSRSGKTPPLPPLTPLKLKLQS